MITKEMTIAEIVQRYPQTIRVFKRYGLDCNECAIAQFEQVSGGAKVHNVDLEELIADLNQVIE